ncbi:hypothetical protein EJB05_56868 [Eragrostis curvula]|uniref:FCP1 homology domain-containing protein n=1 Tax=Eragrostis curvula TaxID=38414 RepID=A0A5J9SGA5_9POAL|nr:hypothetical protein EJB05_56868 [Eragrostis curvula]
MAAPPAKNRASKRRERRRRHAASAAATGDGPDVLAAERGSTAPGNAAAAASSSRRRNRQRKRRRDRAAKTAAEASKSPEAPGSALRGEGIDALGDLHDIANCVSVVASGQGVSSLQSVEAHLSVSLPQTTTKKIVDSNETRKENFQARIKTPKVYSEDGAVSYSVSREDSVGEIETLRSKFFKQSDETCQYNCTALENADTNIDYQNEDSKCPMMKKTSLSGNSEETSPDCSYLQELEKHMENENGASIDRSNLKEETTSQDCPLPNGADDSGLVIMVSEKNTSCLRSMTNSVSVDNAKTKGEIVNLDRAIDKRCELGKNNLNCTERMGLQEQDAAFSEDSNANCLSPSSLAEAYEKLKIVSSPRQSFIGFPKKKLLILDLNGLLADINQDYHNAHMANAKVRGKLVFRRPYCDDFLKFCSQNFDLGVWSSRKKQNVASVVDIVMRDFKPRLLFCWDMSKCTFTGHKTLENMHKPLVLKELKKLWNKEEPDLPWEEGDYSPSNTLLVDDSPYKALRNPPHTAIFPRSYSYLNWNDNSLGPGGDLRMYLQNLAAADDVESFVRNNPFGQSFITESDPHWNFYAQIAGKRSAVAHNGASPLTCSA